MMRKQKDANKMLENIFSTVLRELENTTARLTNAVFISKYQIEVTKQRKTRKFYYS